MQDVETNILLHRVTSSVFILCLAMSQFSGTKGPSSLFTRTLRHTRQSLFLSSRDSLAHDHCAPVVPGLCSSSDGFGEDLFA